jgi:hypothetical protein
MESVDYESRVSKLEVEVESIVSSIQQLSKIQKQDMLETREQLREITAMLGKSGKVNWMLIISVIFGGITAFIGSCGTAITIGSMLSKMSLAPLESKVNFALQHAQSIAVDHKDHTRSGAHQGIDARVSQFEARIDERLGEIETQFMWNSDVNNLQFSKHWTFIQLLYKEAMQESLPGSPYLSNIGKKIKDDK